MKNLNNVFNIIFGGSGFIGQHLVDKLKSNYINLDIVVAPGRDHDSFPYPKRAL